MQVLLAHLDLELATALLEEQGLVQVLHDSRETLRKRMRARLLVLGALLHDTQQILPTKDCVPWFESIYTLLQGFSEADAYLVGAYDDASGHGWKVYEAALEYLAAVPLRVHIALLCIGPFNTDSDGKPRATSLCWDATSEQCSQGGHDHSASLKVTSDCPLGCIVIDRLGWACHYWQA